MKTYITEALGTFVLASAVAIAATSSAPLPVPIIAGLALGLMVYAIGPISGCHINPAVTLGTLSIGKIDKKKAFAYIVFQFIGAGLAYLFVRYGFGHVIQTHDVAAFDSHSVRAFAAETFGAFIFMFGIAAALYGKVTPALSGAVIGGSLALGAMTAGLAGSAGILNPAVALSLLSFTPVYIIAPIVGSVLAMQAYKHLLPSA